MTLKRTINSPGSLEIRRCQSLTDAAGAGSGVASWLASSSSNLDGGVPIETGAADKLAGRFKQSADQGGTGLSYIPEAGDEFCFALLQYSAKR